MTDTEVVLGPGLERSSSDRRAVDRRRRVRLLAGSAVFVVPLAVALVALHDPRWYPALELAETELHVRDVGTSHTPLTGLIGRLGVGDGRGSHPGPLSFFVLAPVYRLAGATGWALQVATATLHLAAIAGALGIAHRRGGKRLLLLMGAAMAVLVRFYGPSLLTEPWNPYLPMLWWVVFVLAVWSVVEDDLALLPVAVFAGSLCAQTHISYVGLVGGLGAGALAVVLVRHLRGRRSGRAPTRVLRWLGISAATGVLLWLPPVLDELKGGEGNLSVIVDYFTASTEVPIGPLGGIELLLANLDPWRLLVGEAQAKVIAEAPSWSITGVVFLGAWAASVIVAWRLRQRSVLRFDAVLGVALGLGAISTSRIYGATWAWLVQWAWGLTACLAIAIAWTAVGAVQRQLMGSPTLRQLHVGAVGALAAIALASAAGMTVDAARVDPDDVPSSRSLAALLPATLEALQEAPASRGAEADRYLITTTDPVGVVGELQVFGLLNGLDRHGVPVGVEGAKRLRAAPHLTLDAAEVTAVLRVVTGPAIEEWEQRVGARRIAFYDPRTPEQRATQVRWRAEVDEELRVLGLADLIPAIDGSFVASMFQFDNDPRIPQSLPDKMRRSLALGTPSAVFLEG